MDEEIQKHVKSIGPLVGMIALVLGLGYFRQVLVLTILLFAICVLLVVSILIQAHRGGGLVGALGGMGGESTFGTSAMPVKKFTAGMAILFMVAVIVLGKAKSDTSVVEQALEQKPAAVETEAPEGAEESAEADKVADEKPEAPPKKEPEAEGGGKEGKKEKTSD